MSLVAKVELIPGFLRITNDSGLKHQIAVADVLRAADIPALTYTQVAAITNLADLVAILVRTLIERGILDESFSDSLGLDMDLEHIIKALEDMGGSYHEPSV